jgi:hypothetical protein
MIAGQHLLAPSGALSSLLTANQQILTGRQFFPATGIIQQAPS